MAIQLFSRKKKEDKVDFMQFLSGALYAAFLKQHRKERMVLLELGVGFNTPTIIRFPFEKMVREEKKWSLIRLNLEEAVVPDSFGRRAVGINEDIARSIEDIKRAGNAGQRERSVRE